MIYVGIDVAKDKHDCFITNSDGEVLFKPFTISNNRDGLETLFQRIQSVSDDLSKSFNRFLIISLDVLICRYSPSFRAFPALFISEEPHKSFYYPSCFRSQK